MHKFTLELLFQIIGIGSASGLVHKENSLFLISDNSSILYEYNIQNEKLDSYPLLENNGDVSKQKNIPKKIKPDFESIAVFGEDCYIFGSGSTENRNKMIHFDTNKKEKIGETDLTDLYLVMQSFGNIKPDEFNIEGAIYTGEKWFLFNRGNSESRKNGIFTIGGNNLTDDFSVLYNSYKLPAIKGIPSSFTDAVQVRDKIYFLATVENTGSTYEDGIVYGSFIGRIDIEKMKIDYTQKISDKHKFEGLSVLTEEEKTIEFYLCEDNDTDTLESNVYKLTLTK
ncbi:hypothetical protein [uncultured Flavobacterium sp.]|uniref:DUF6929 family protein n=1 Tax=uncultured Flavobacterium sp. TaxID=165435 RepID=UPI0025F3D716|nr:hypothetical protein [uncultured Flavobacterium sp.]